MGSRGHSEEQKCLLPIKKARLDMLAAKGRAPGMGQLVTVPLMRHLCWQKVCRRQVMKDLFRSGQLMLLLWL